VLAQPREIWALWQALGLERATLHGFWEADKSAAVLKLEGCADVKVTSYVVYRRLALVVLASWQARNASAVTDRLYRSAVSSATTNRSEGDAADGQLCSLLVAWSTLGLAEDRAVAFAPSVPTWQGAQRVRVQSDGRVGPVHVHAWRGRFVVLVDQDEADRLPHSLWRTTQQLSALYGDAYPELSEMVKQGSHVQRR
jgi:hypothetical protein